MGSVEFIRKINGAGCHRGSRGTLLGLFFAAQDFHLAEWTMVYQELRQNLNGFVRKNPPKGL